MSATGSHHSSGATPKGERPALEQEGTRISNVKRDLNKDGIELSEKALIILKEKRCRRTPAGPCQADGVFFVLENPRS